MQQLDIFSASGSSSLSQSSNNTGQTASTGATSPSLLPTPTVNGNYNRKGLSNKSGDGLATALQSSPVASPASHSVPLDEEKERQMTAISGRTCLRLYDIQNPNGSSLKTCVASLLGTTAWYSKQCALTWKAKVTKSNRLLFQLSPSVRPIAETESGLLLTPNVMDNLPPRNKEALDRQHNNNRPGRTTPSTLREQIAYGRTVAEHTPTGLVSGKKLRLQPAMTQWMMGYPDLWTEFPLVEPDGEKTV